MRTNKSVKFKSKIKFLCLYIEKYINNNNYNMIKLHIIQCILKKIGRNNFYRNLNKLLVVVQIQKIIFNLNFNKNRKADFLLLFGNYEKTFLLLIFQLSS